MKGVWIKSVACKLCTYQGSLIIISMNVILLSTCYSKYRYTYFNQGKALLCCSHLVSGLPVSVPQPCSLAKNDHAWFNILSWQDSYSHNMGQLMFFLPRYAPVYFDILDTYRQELRCNELKGIGIFCITVYIICNIGLLL